jgi:uncharacterized protein YkwD
MGRAIGCRAAAVVVALVFALVLAASASADPLLAPRRACSDPAVGKLPLGKVLATAPARGRFRPGHALPAWWWQWARYRLHEGKRPSWRPARIPAWAWNALRRFEKRRGPKTPAALAAMVCLHKYAHRRSGLPRFHVNRKLSRAAALKIRKMISCGQFGHTPCGINTATYEWQVGFTGTWWGENAAFFSDRGGFSGVRHTFDAWLNSPDHRFSILFGHYDQLGIAAAHVRNLGAYGYPGVIWVVNFGSRT